MIEKLEKLPIYRQLERASQELCFSFTLKDAQKQVTFGSGENRFTITLKDHLSLTNSLSEHAIGLAYIDGQFDIEGDMLALFELRRYLAGRANWAVRLGFLRDLLLRPAQKINKPAIDQHYMIGPDFYHCFQDTAYRLYSHCFFENEDDTLEDAARRKVATIYTKLGLKPGMRLLEIGGGWGGLAAYCAQNGVDVTVLTLFEDSKHYIEEMIKRQSLTHCRVILQDFLDYEASEPFDAIVNLGVIEHLPNYRHFTQRLWNCLKPGGLAYTDGAASIQKYDIRDFTRRHIWQGTHSFMCLQDLVMEFLLNGFEIVEVTRETKDYERTMFHWASRFDQHREALIEKYGERRFRTFQLYLWAGTHGFKTNAMQAYHLITQRRESPGLRPGLARRTRYFISSLT